MMYFLKTFQKVPEDILNHRISIVVITVNTSVLVALRWDTLSLVDSLKNKIYNIAHNHVLFFRRTWLEFM